MDLVLLATKLTKKICDPSKAKEHYKLFKKKKGEQIHKTSSNSEIKSVAVKHPKASSNLSKFIEQSNIITQELETKEKKYFSHRISYYPKSTAKLSKAIKQPTSITQE